MFTLTPKAHTETTERFPYEHRYSNSQSNRTPKHDNLIHRDLKGASPQTYRDGSTYVNPLDKQTDRQKPHDHLFRCRRPLTKSNIDYDTSPGEKGSLEDAHSQHQLR